MKKLIVLLSLLILSLFAGGCAFRPAEFKPDETVRVLLRMTDPSTGSVSGMCADVLPGESAVFDLSGNGLYPIEVPEGAEFDEARGTLTVSAVRYPSTLDVTVIAGTVTSDSVKLLTFAENSGGTVTFEEGKRDMKPGYVTVRAAAKDGYTFTGWSRGGYLSAGGTSVGKEETYRFLLLKDDRLYANFRKQDSYTIVYHTGDGTVAATGEKTYTVTAKYQKQFPMQQTLYENGTFTRQGYVAVGYSTEPAVFENYSDCNQIPGFCNVGGVCTVPTDTGKLDLYVVWAKETPASDFTMSGSKITKYKGSAKILVIPPKIGGVTVTSVAAGAVSGSNLTRVVLPPTVKTLADNAFSGCPNLREVVFFDGVETLSNASFTSCPEITTVVLNSGRLPRYATNYEGLFCIKYERLRTLKGKKLVVVSGSSSLEGTVSADLEAAFPSYQVINFGTIAPYPAVFLLDVISRYTGNGDLIVFAPEYMMAQQMGSTKFNGKIFRGFEMCYDIFREVDMREYSNFFTSFHDFQNGGGEENIPKAAKSSKGYEYQTPFAYMNEYGDYTIDRSTQKVGVGSGSTNYSISLLKPAPLNEMYRRIKAKGGEMVMTFCPYDASAASSAMKNEDNARKFADDCAAKLDFEVISTPYVYLMDHKYFYDSFWHLSETGAAIRTQNLIADLRKYFAGK